LGKLTNKENQLPNRELDLLKTLLTRGSFRAQPPEPPRVLDGNLFSYERHALVSCLAQLGR